MEKIILFDAQHRDIQKDGTAYSAVLYIPQGKVALLSLYNMYVNYELITDPDKKAELQNNSCVDIQKLSYEETEDLCELAKGLECDSTISIQEEMQKILAKRQVRFEPIYQCNKAWRIDPCNNMALIPIAGYFRLHVKDVTQIETAYIECYLLDGKDALTIPSAFKLGSN